MCVYIRLGCAGIPRLSLKNFAQLQAEQRSPFQNFGAYAVKQGSTLHLWLWDKAIETAFSGKHPGRISRSVIPQSLLSEPLEHGVHWLRHVSQNGIEAQLWRNKQLVDSIYFVKPPSAQDWSARLLQSPELNALGWPTALPLSADRRDAGLEKKVWARNLLMAALRLPAIQGAAIAHLTLWAFTAVLAAGTASILSERALHQKAITEGVENQKQRLAALEPVQQARETVKGLESWLASAQTLSPQPTKLDILNSIAVMLTRQGLTVRDLELSPPTVSATLLPPPGSDIRLTAVIAAIEANPMFTDARFVDVVGGTAFKFTWRLRDVRSASALGAPAAGAAR
jgi:hypothetical protein